MGSTQVDVVVVGWGLLKWMLRWWRGVCLGRCCGGRVGSTQVDVVVVGWVSTRVDVVVVGWGLLK